MRVDLDGVRLQLPWPGFCADVRVRTRTKAAQVPADQRLPCIRHGDVLSMYPARDVLRHGQSLERDPAGEHHVNDHERLVFRSVDEDVVGCLIWAMECELELLTADIQDIPLVERHARAAAAAIVPVMLTLDDQRTDLNTCARICRSATVDLVGGERVEVTTDSRTASFYLPSLPAQDGTALL